MSGSNPTPQVLGAATSTGAGITVLPNTGGNTVGQILAWTAITLGVAALVGQLVVRVVRSTSR